MGPVRAIAAFALCAACAAMSACDSPRTPLDARDLDTAAQQLQSAATEGEWLVRQLQAGHITRNMAWVHQQALAQDAGKAVEPLAKPVPRELRDRHAQVLQLAARLQAQLVRIAPDAREAADLDAVQRELDSVARAAKPLGRQA